MLIISIEMIRAKKVEICPETKRRVRLWRPSSGESQPAPTAFSTAEYKWPFLYSAVHLMTLSS